MEYQQKLQQKLIEAGAAAVGFADISRHKSKTDISYPYAVSIMYKLSYSIMDEIKNAPTYQYFSHYRIVNTQLDLLSLHAVRILEDNGFKAYPVAASQSIPNELDKYSGVISHKLVAVESGLGFIGKSNLLVTERFGSRIRLASVLTDAPFETGSPIKCLCGECDLCVKACPSGAISGKEYVLGEARESIFNAAKCSEFMKKAYNHIGRGVVCGRCICKKF